MDTFRYNATGIDPDAPAFPLIPDGWYPFRIMETESQQSSKGNPMVLAKCKCIDSRYPDAGMIWHYVVFIPNGQPGDRMNVHFRKCIGVPWEGDVVVDPYEWVGKTFMGKVVTEEYKEKKSNKFKEISPIKKESMAALEAMTTKTARLLVINMKIKGSIIALKASVNASGDTPRRVTFEVFGDFAALHALLNKPLDIDITEEQSGGPFDDR